MSTENRRLGTPVHHETGKSRKEKTGKQERIGGVIRREGEFLQGLFF